MNFIRNILAIIGLVAIVGGAFAYTKFAPMMAQMGDMDIGAEKAALDSFDPKAKDVYMEMWTKLKASGNSADATVVKYSLADGVTWQDAEESMKSIANKLNIKAVGELPLSEQVQLETGKEQRFLKIYQFCNPQTAMKMVDFSDAFSAYAVPHCDDRRQRRQISPVFPEYGHDDLRRQNPATRASCRSAWGTGNHDRDYERRRGRRFLSIVTCFVSDWGRATFFLCRPKDHTERH